VPDPPVDSSDLGESLEEGLFREDVSTVVALDGVVGDSLRGAMLDEVTQPGWRHDTAEGPPTPKWERETNDGISAAPQEVRLCKSTPIEPTVESAWCRRLKLEIDKLLSSCVFNSNLRQYKEGGGGPQLKVAPNSWGLSEEALEQVGRSAPVAALLARLGALYPEYHGKVVPAETSRTPC